MQIERLDDVEIAGAVVSIWLADLRITGNLECSQTLSSDELRRANSFIFATDAQRYRLSRGALRQVLGYLTGIAPRRLLLETGTFGKPYLHGHERLQFNVSHSADWCVIAVVSQFGNTGAAGVGVDIEAERETFDLQSLIEHVCTDSEARALTDLPEHQLGAAFVTLWTRKEACLKALGMGLQLEPRTFITGYAPKTMRVELVSSGNQIYCELTHLRLPVHGLVASLALHFKSRRSSP